MIEVESSDQALIMVNSGWTSNWNSKHTSINIDGQSGAENLKFSTDWRIWALGKNSFWKAQVG